MAAKERPKLNTSENDMLLTLAAMTTTIGMWNVINVKPPALLDFIDVTPVDEEKIYDYMNKSMLIVGGIAAVFAMIHGRRGYYVPSIIALLTGGVMYAWTDYELKKKHGLLR